MRAEGVSGVTPHNCIKINNEGLVHIAFEGVEGCGLLAVILLQPMRSISWKSITAGRKEYNISLLFPNPQTEPREFSSLEGKSTSGKSGRHQAPQQYPLNTLEQGVNNGRENRGFRKDNQESEQN